MYLSLRCLQFLCLFFAYNAYSWQGLSVHSAPKYIKNLSHLEYANPNAEKGGRIVVGWTGSFDTLNPFTPKGISPLFLERLVFQSLGVKTLDEPLTKYPLLAKDFKLSPDKLSLVISLNEKARFSDGNPVTVDDIKFSFDLFSSDKVNPFYKSYWQDIKSVKVLDKQRVQFNFSKYNPELPAITTDLTILPKHIYSKGNFSKDFVSRAIGSGPYRVKRYKVGSSIVYEKNPVWWANENNFHRGQYNFNEIEIQYYKDDTAKVEAFKKGSFDIFICYSSKVWAKDLTGDLFDRNVIKKDLWEHSNNQGSQGFYFNLRNKIFQDVRVRKAIALAFDFEWTNKTLFYSQYKENGSFFENSEFQARGLPVGKEKLILEKLKKSDPEAVPSDVFVVPAGGLSQGLGKSNDLEDMSGPYKSQMTSLLSTPKGTKLNFKDRLKLGMFYLKSAGFSVVDGVMTHADGRKLKFSFLLSSRSMARVVEPYLKNLKKLGVVANIEVKESSVYQRRLQGREFDMIVLSIGQSQSPGNEQIDLWHSDSSEIQYSRNHYGLKNSAVDKLVDKIIYAKSREELVDYTRALDRILYHQHIAVQNWHSESHRVAFWNKYSYPQKFPDYYYPTTLLDFMWLDSAKQKKLAVEKKK